MKRTLHLTTAIAVLFLIAGCGILQKSPDAAAPETIRIGGGDAALTEVINPVKETFEEENPLLRLVTVQSTPGTELSDLTGGNLDAVVSAIPLERLLRGVVGRGPASTGKLFREVPIGRNKTVIFLNHGIKIKKLTKKQLKSVFVGKITNWKRLGGPNRHIVVVWSPTAAGENDLFINGILEGERVVADYVPVATAEEMRAKVLETPGAIGIGPNALVAPGVRVPLSPTFCSSVVLITKGEPSPKVRKLLDLINDVAFLP